MLYVYCLIRTGNNRQDGKIIKARVTKKYKKTDKGKSAMARNNHNRRTNIRNTINTLTAKEFKYIIHLQKNKCACCGRTFNDELNPTRDHIVPVSIGGNFTKDSVQALCQSCNSSKGAQYIDYRNKQHKNNVYLG